jgi:hypothetical protein
MISALFAVDSLAGGFLTAALLNACPDAVDHSRRLKDGAARA